MTTPADLTADLIVLAAGRPLYNEAESYYENSVPEVFSSYRLKQLLAKTAGSFRVNFARTPVDVLIERTEISGITSDSPAVEEYLNAMWEENELDLDAKDIHRMVFEFGDSYLIALPDEEAESGVSAYAHDPRYVRVFYDPARPRKKTHAIQTWTERGGAADGNVDGLPEGLWFRANRYYPDRTEMWVSRYPIDDGFGNVLLDVEHLELDLIDAMPNETGVVPVFHFRNQKPYGRPEHADAYGPQNMINKLAITMMASVDYAGFPQRWMLTDDAQGGDQWDQSAPDQSAEPQYDASPGATWLIENAKSTGQYEVAQSDNFLKPIHSLVQQMAAVTDTPMHYFDLTGGMPSGESYRAANGPLDKKTEDRQARLARTWREFFEYALMLARIAPADTMLNWKPAHTFTDNDTWLAANQQLAAGIPAEQVWRERGYPEDVIAEWLREKARKEAELQAQMAENGPPQPQNDPNKAPTNDPPTGSGE